MRRALFLQHEDLGPPGLIGECAVESGVEVVSVMVPEAPELPQPAGFDLIVSLGSPNSANDTHVPWVAAESALLRAAIDRRVPILGICFGGQMLAHALGAAVRKGPHPEIGWLAIETSAPDLIPSGPWMQWHYEVFEVPAGATEIARSPAGPQAFTYGPHLALQFHPEPTPEILHAWLRASAKELARSRVDVARIVADTERHGEQARQAARRLFEAFCAGAVRRGV
jgi:GMP synthase-like glutamine amidotransferase